MGASNDPHAWDRARAKRERRAVVFFWFLLLLLIALTVVGALLTPKPHFGQPQPNALGDFRFPTAEEGRAIPIICGTVKIQGGNSVWWGDLEVVAITQRVKTGLFSHKTVTTGYKYYLGVQFALCSGPIDTIVGMESSKKPVPFTKSGSDVLTLTIDAPNLFGGDQKEGGISGTMRLYRGTQTQGSDAYLSQKQTSIGPSSSIVYSGSGNGGLSFVAPGAASVNENITITALNSFSSAGDREFSVVGSVSGSIGTAAADNPFSSGQINFTITTGSLPFATGDHWIVTTSTTRISPSYHGLCYAVLQHLYLGTSSYVKPIAFILKRCPDPLGLGSTFANLNNGDANPAEFVYELLTDVENGLGINPARINTASFITAATTLKDENLGISMQIDSQGKADEIIGDVLRHCDGVIYVDPQTGLWNMVLARADYDPTTIPEVTVDDIQASPTFARGSWSETTNQVIIKYLDRNANYNTRSVQAQDPANISVTGELRTQTIEFNAISNSATASLIASRVLKTLTYPLSKLTIKLNRKAWNWRVAGVFKMTWLPLGISDQVFRVTQIRYGQLTDGTIEVDAVEDIFGLNFAAFDAPPDSGWTNPIGAPQAPAFQKLEECPLELIDPSTADGIYAMTIVARNDPTEKSYEVWQPVAGTDTFTNEVGAFCPIGLLENAYPAATPANDATGLILQLNGVGLDGLVATDSGGLLVGVNLALIDDEIIAWEGVTLNMDGTRTLDHVVRGCYDTVPVDHRAGALVYLFSNGVGLTQLTPYAADLTVQAKFLPKNNSGTFLLSSASYVNLVTRSRWLRPYPPGDFLMQGLGYGLRYKTTLLDVAFTWASRNRLTQNAGNLIVLQDHADITPEAGTTYTVKVTIGGSLVRTDTGIVVENYTYTAAMRVADGGVGAVTLQVFANANSLDSFQAQTAVFEMTGFGLDFGKVFGGKQA
jgi:hypothetical protein